jgi:hypothetical protein
MVATNKAIELEIKTTKENQRQVLDELLGLGTIVEPLGNTSVYYRPDDNEAVFNVLSKLGVEYRNIEQSWEELENIQLQNQEVEIKRNIREIEQTIETLEADLLWQRGNRKDLLAQLTEVQEKLQNA